MNTRIKEVRKHFKMNQTEFGEKIGVKQSAVAGYENGSRTPIDAVVLAICREFGVNQIWLQTGDGEMLAPTTSEDDIAMIVNKMSFKDEPAKKAAITTFMNASEEQVMLFLQMLYKELKKNGIEFDE